MSRGLSLYRRAGVILKVIAIVAVAVGIIITMKYFNLQEVFRNALSWIDGSGSVGLLVFFGLYVAACVFMIPGTILTLGAGAVFGVVKGSLLVSLSSTVGATAAFIVSTKGMSNADVAITQSHRVLRERLTPCRARIRS